MLRLVDRKESAETEVLYIEGAASPAKKGPRHVRSLREVISEHKPIGYQHRGTEWETVGLKIKYYIRINSLGFPDFSGYAIAIVRIPMTGDRRADEAMANKAAEIPPGKKYRGFTWHHHQDRRTMLLIPTELHNAFRHSGGVWAIRKGGQRKP
jgi:hypothetical protein